MNDPISKPTVGQPDASRRRFAKAGLAAPVVLATLASKPVLANPWTCTISGQMSGNVSGHESETCTALGNTHTELRDRANQSDATRAVKLSTIFSGLPIYLFSGGLNSLQNAASPPTPSWSEATIYQILSMDATGFEYAVKAVVLLLNAKGKTDTSNYYITESQARGLYETAANPSHPDFTDTDPDVTWHYDTPLGGPNVQTYIDVLYR